MSAQLLQIGSARSRRHHEYHLTAKQLARGDVLLLALGAHSMFLGAQFATSHDFAFSVEADHPTLEVWLPGTLAAQFRLMPVRGSGGISPLQATQSAFEDGSAALQSPLLVTRSPARLVARIVPAAVTAGSGDLFVEVVR